MQTVVYKTNQLYSQLNNIFIKLDVQPINSRTKSSKLILDISDIQEYIWRDYGSDNCLNELVIYEMVKRLCCTLHYVNTATYSILKIPMDLIVKDPVKYKYDLQNSFDYDIPTGGSNKGSPISAKQKSMLTPVLRAVRVIYQSIKKIGNQYVIISVRMFKYYNHYLLQIYIPKTARLWVCVLHPRDILQFTPQFVNQLIPLSILGNKLLLKQTIMHHQDNYQMFSHFYRLITRWSDEFVDTFNQQLQENANKSAFMRSRPPYDRDSPLKQSKFKTGHSKRIHTQLFQKDAIGPKKLTQNFLDSNHSFNMQQQQMQANYNKLNASQQTPDIHYKRIQSYECNLQPLNSDRDQTKKGTNFLNHYPQLTEQNGNPNLPPIKSKYSTQYFMKSQQDYSHLQGGESVISKLDDNVLGEEFMDRDQLSNANRTLNSIDNQSFRESNPAQVTSKYGTLIMNKSPQMNSQFGDDLRSNLDLSYVSQSDQQQQDLRHCFKTAYQTILSLHAHSPQEPKNETF